MRRTRLSKTQRSTTTHRPGRTAQPTDQRRALIAFVESLRWLQPVDEVVRQIVIRIQSGFDVSWCELLLRDEARARLSLARIEGNVPEPLLSIPLDAVQLNLLRDQERPVRPPDTKRWRDWKRFGVAIALPLVEDSRWIGLILIGERRGTWTRSDLSLLNKLRRRATVAIENGRQYGEAIQSRDDLAAVFEASLVASSLLDLRDALERLSEHMAHALDVDGVTLSAWEPERGRLINWLGYRRKSFEPRDTLGSFQLLSEMPAARDVLTGRRPCVISSIQSQAHPLEARWLNEYGIAQMVMLPLVARDSVIGLARLYTLDLSRTFKPIELQLAQTLSAQAAVTIDNARLIEELRDASRTLERKVADRTSELERTMRRQQIEASRTLAIIESVNDGVVVVDPSGTLTLVNAAAENILGRPRAQLLGLRLADLESVLGEAIGPWMRAMQEWLGGDRSHEEHMLLGERTIHAILSPVSLGREAQGLVSVLRDVTREVEVSRAKSEFVSLVSHELRTPMTAMKGYVDLVVSGVVGPVTDEQRQFLKIIRSNIDRLTGLVNDLLDISRIETGRVQLNITRVSVDAVVADVALTLQTRLDEKQHAFESRVPPGLPPVRADAGRLTQILTNLIGNAIAYTPPGGWIMVSAHAGDRFAVIEVSDAGIGIALEDQKRIFDRFFRADHPVVREAKGTGLGLPIVQSLVEMQGGRIWVRSEPGQGSTFSFTLPLWEPDEEALLDPAEGDPHAAQTAAG